MDAARYGTLARRWWWLLLVGTVMAIAAYGVAARLRERDAGPPVYDAHATLFVSLRPETAAEAADTTLVDNPWDLDRLLASYAQVIGGDAVAARTMRDLGLDMAPPGLRQSINAAPVAGTQLIQVTAQAASPADAAALRDAVVRALDEVRVETRLPGQARLFEVTPPAVHGGRSISEPLTLLLVALAGLASATGIVLTFEYISDSVRDARDVETITGVPILATLPLRREMSRYALMPSGAVAERFRILRTSMSTVTGEQAARIVLVTAPRQGCGASSVAAGYAAALARAGRRVLLVDANLRCPSIHQTFDISGRPGFADALRGAVEIEAITSDAGIDGLAVIAAGETTLNPADLLVSPRLSVVLEGLRARFDAIVVDAPPVLDSADASILAAKADVAILVARTDVTTRTDAAAAVETLRRAGVQVIGVVLNADGSVRGGSLMAGLRMPGRGRAEKTARSGATG